VYDPQGRLRLYNRYGSGAQALAADVAINSRPIGQEKARTSRAS
jgi:hypothetical protein